MQNEGRDKLGRFVPGRKPSLEELRKKEEGRKRYYATNISNMKLREQNPYIFNSWRALLYNEKGKKAGYSTEEWKDFKNFYNDVSSTYVNGYKFHRIDTSIPFSKDNFIWISPTQAATLNNKDTVYINYQGEDYTLKEAALKYNQSCSAVRNRYFKHKNDFTVEEIIFGRKTKRGSKIPKNAEKNSQAERNKVSKLISSYKCKDKKHGHSECDFDAEWMIENIMHKECIYCGDTNRLGCDRIDNNKGHTKDNVVPCCYDCNVARGNNFSYKEMIILGKTIRKIKQKRKNNKEIK